MTYLSAALAILLPWWIGSATLALIRIQDKNNNLFRTLGEGFFVGMVLIYAVLWVQDIAGFKLQIPWVGLLLAAFLLFVALWRSRAKNQSNSRDQSASKITPLAWLWLGAFGLLALLALTDAFLRPIFPWDAWYYYHARSQVYAYFQQFVESVGTYYWAEIADPLAYSFDKWQPEAASYISTWTALAMGQWDESLVNLAWPCALIAIFLTITGFSLSLGNSFSLSCGVSLLVVSSPLILIHATLGGYADIWVGGFLMAAATLSIGGLLENNKKLLLMVFFLLLACAVTKRSAPAYVLMLITACCFYGLPERVRLIGVTAVLFVVVGIFFLLENAHSLNWSIGVLGEHLAIHDGQLEFPFFHSYQIHEAQPAAGILVREFFVESHFHILPWMFAGTFLAALWYIRRDRASAAFIVWCVLLMCLLLAAHRYTRAFETLTYGFTHQRLMMSLLLPGSVLAIGAMSSLVGARKESGDRTLGKGPSADSV